MTACFIAKGVFDEVSHGIRKPCATVDATDTLRAHGNKRPQSGTTLDEAHSFEFAIRTLDRVGVDRDLHDNLTDRWELVAHLQGAFVHRTTHLVDQLAVGGKW